MGEEEKTKICELCGGAYKPYKRDVYGICRWCLNTYHRELQYYIGLLNDLLGRKYYNKKHECCTYKKNNSDQTSSSVVAFMGSPGWGGQGGKIIYKDIDEAIKRVLSSAVSDKAILWANPDVAWQHVMASGFLRIYRKHVKLLQRYMLEELFNIKAKA